MPQLCENQVNNVYALFNEKFQLNYVFFSLEPELNKLKNKACGRVREFLLDKINILKKPMTNVEN